MNRWMCSITIGYKINAVVLGRLKRFIHTPMAQEEDQEQDLMSYAHEFSIVSPETMSTSKITERHESNCYICNREFVTDRLGPGDRYPEFLLFFPESF